MQLLVNTCLLVRANSGWAFDGQCFSINLVCKLCSAGQAGEFEELNCGLEGCNAGRVPDRRRVIIQEISSALIDPVLEEEVLHDSIGMNT